MEIIHLLEANILFLSYKPIEQEWLRSASSLDVEIKSSFSVANLIQASPIKFTVIILAAQPAISIMYADNCPPETIR